MEYKIDIDNKDYYDHSKSEIEQRTKDRLTQIAESGMSEVGYGQFGVRDIMSGLYIEKVWNYSDEDFKSYMDWAINLIYEKTLVECYWCNKEFRRRDMLTVQNAEFLEPSHPICKTCNAEHDLV